MEEVLRGQRTTMEWLRLVKPATDQEVVGLIGR